jgi:CheY-like chemotaxis protein
MAILLIEDDDSKREQIHAFLSSINGSWSIETAKSVKSGIGKLRHATYSLLILDMSLPTFDVSADEGGGRPQGFGGIEVMRFMDANELRLPTLVVTGYEAFSRDGRTIDLGVLGGELSKEFPDCYRGIVYFNTMLGAWKQELRDLISEHGSEL